MRAAKILERGVSETEQLIVHVKTIHCGSCERRIEKAVSRLDGVRQVKADHRSGEVHVALEAGRVTEADVRTSVERAGFEVAT